MTKSSKTTSLDIAYLAGVSSRSTGSRALSGSSLVNAETREKVEASAYQLNCQVDRSLYPATPDTSTRQNTLHAGEVLVDNPLKIVCGETAASDCIPTERVVRKSCGAI